MCLYICIPCPWIHLVTDGKELKYKCAPIKPPKHKGQLGWGCWFAKRTKKVRFGLFQETSLHRSPVQLRITKIAGNGHTWNINIFGLIK